MKNKIYRYITMLAVMIMAVGTFSTGTDAASLEDGIDLEMKPFLQIERKFKKVEMVHGESEYQKRERESRTGQSLQSRNVVARERSSETENIDLESLRALYREAGAKYGIDPKLIEAVHQIETGKSGTTCKRNPSGATGPMQFLPSTFRAYSDGGDICNVRDAIFAAANLLTKSGADVGDIDGALFNYNHSTSYVRTVKQIMESI